MERLTEHHVNKTLGAYMVCSGACIDDNFDCNGCKKLEEMVDRLAAYEDTMPLERAQELAQAEKDGRLVVLSPNDPLTLEELREMDGEPVWVVQTSGELRPFWMLVDTEDESAANRLYAALFEDYGTEWLAYRRKPEEIPYEGLD